MTKLIKIHLFILGLFMFVASLQAHVLITHPTVEGRTEPLGLDVPAPRMGWKIVSDKKNVIQKSYHLIVCSSIDKAMKHEGDVWDSGVIKSQQSQWVSLDGLRLSPNQDYYWLVKVRTNKGDSEWSKSQRWSTGMLGSSWKGYWIGTDSLFEGETASKFSRIAARYLRKNFKAGGKIRKAMLHVCGLGLYQLHINGRKISSSELAPLGTDYNKTLIYDTYDVTQALSSKNVMMLTLGAGNYFAPRQKYQVKVRSTYGMPTALLNLIIEYEDGHVDTLATDDTWKLNVNGPIRYSNFYDGERYDATKDLGDVFNWEYDDSKWLQAQRMSAPSGRLRGNMSNPITIYRVDHPVKIWKTKSGSHLVDFGTNEAGRVRIQLKGLKKDDCIKIKYAELLGKDGVSLYTDNLRSAENLDTYIAKGQDGEGMDCGILGAENKNVWAPLFTYHGFRYVEISGLSSLSPSDIQRELLADEMSDEDTQFFAAEHDKPSLLNRLVENARRGIRSNYKGMPIDCPQRDERMPWLGDRTMGCLGESYLMDNRALYAKWMNDIEDSQREDGNISDVSPSYWRLYTNNVTWPAAFPFGCEMLYRQYGDDAPIRQHYASIKKFLSYIRKECSKNGLISKDKYGDWCMPPERLDMIFSKDSTRITNGELISSCYYAYLCQMMARFCSVDSTVYMQEARSMIDAINRKYLKDGQYDNGTITANLLPLAMGFVPREEKAMVEKKLLDSILAADEHVGCGVIGIQWLMRYLSDCGHGELAYRIATQTSYPGWGYMIENGATTIWELWNGNTANPAMNSGNHVMLLGDVLPWCYERLGGISPLKPGFKETLIAPDFMVNILNKVEVSHSTPYGPVRSFWQRNGDESIEWQVSIPANTKAVLVMPDGKRKKVGSGTYVFKIN